jgi:hypothetical protein
VYFFFEDGENRQDSGTGPRIVRVGTHGLRAGSKSTLWGRLSQHRGSARTGTGNHRGSIFRLLAGTALIASGATTPIESWGRGASTPRDVTRGEVELERLVSACIGNMPCLWIGIDDPPGPESDRGYIERNSIALLSNWSKPALDPPSAIWLGRHCSRERVQSSGLWNSDHVDEAYEPAFLTRFETLIDGSHS